MGISNLLAIIIILFWALVFFAIISSTACKRPRLRRLVFLVEALWRGGASFLFLHLAIGQLLYWDFHLLRDRLMYNILWTVSYVVIVCCLIFWCYRRMPYLKMDSFWSSANVTFVA